MLWLCLPLLAFASGVLVGRLSVRCYRHDRIAWAQRRLQLKVLSLELKSLRGYGLLTLKPVLVVFNAGEASDDPTGTLDYDHRKTLTIALQGRLEAEIAQLGDSDDVAMFEATHGTAPKYAGLDKVNPGSLILSAEMMLRHMGWTEAADLIVKSTEAAIKDKVVTYDFARLMDGATEVSCSAFGDAMIERM